MIPSVNYKEVKIYITTYKHKSSESKMSERKCIKRCEKDVNNRFICSICLNSNSRDCDVNRECDKKGLSCPKCRQSCVSKLPPKINSKTVQTSQTNINQDLNLLKEVLTVFQNSKQVVPKKQESETLMKDVSVETEVKTELKQKLSKTRTFQFSITEESNVNKTENFKIIHYSEPEKVKSSQFHLDLTKCKSSSIPQMKMEELKYYLKEKTRSKDAIEEVNRMFATVRRNDEKGSNDCNRPFVRTGPRVLPVVRTYQKNKDSSDSEVEKIHEPCKCCHDDNLQLSGGDSFFKHECCYQKMMSKGKCCDKCVYMMCCHYEKHNKTDRVLVCDRCNESRKKGLACDHSHV